ncbi:response regulator [Leptospira meyeri]|uniref:Response regulator receiver domain-containing protein n=1 Tax=Leptospira meyeri TaxID=29508 RepID=A0A4R8MPF5_LEPME|nr:response regulator [Leptospira meyeri]EKJ88549.1 response regulator receiver domain protein [Leptospira meyeri serovar Hardjo str. Went 5]EMJ86618.1 response regulator receiver domain protein [Leptospira meyeri serovar Semaranga str. Veldrot Semarang 173]TDY71090.1 response regulator receiver domain-containing protein [Leptospira meyeri]TGL52875.1 response regulator [Leptospira meyeri]
MNDTKTKRKLLYVDDEILNLYLFRDYFKNEFEVIVAKSGKEAIEELNENLDVQFVISDMRMPEMNGLEFITKAKTIRPNITYCILTGYDLTPEIQSAIIENKVARYFSKPFDPAEISSFLSAGS